MSNTATIIARSPLLKQMTSKERERFFSLIERNTYPKGETILREGRSIQMLWIIVDGQCEVLKETRNGGDQQLAVLEPGAIFGEMSFFDAAPHSASVRALTDVEVLRLSRQKFDELQKMCPEAAYRIALATAEILAARLRKMDEWICELVERPDGAHHREEWREFRAKLYSDWKF